MEDINKKRLDELSRRSPKAPDRDPNGPRRRRGPYGPMRPVRDPGVRIQPHGKVIGNQR